MLETIRQYALTKLVTSGEVDIVRRHHATYYLGLVDTAIRANPTELTQRTLMDLLETEHGNLQAALAWSQSAQGSAELGLRLADTLGWFWRARWRMRMWSGYTIRSHAVGHCISWVIYAHP